MSNIAPLRVAPAVFSSTDLRDFLTRRIEHLIAVVDQLDGDADLEVDDLEDEGIDEPDETPAAPCAWIGSGFSEGDRQGFSEVASTVTRKDSHFERDRIRSVLLRYGPEEATDSEVLAALLSVAAGPRVGTLEVANLLIDRFGSMSEVLAAPAIELTKHAAIGVRSAGNLKIVLAAIQRFGREKVSRTKPLLTSWTNLLLYLRAAMAFEATEQLRLLFLDKKNRLIADEVQQRGTVDHTPVYVREVIKRSLEVGATAIILVHNHPSGDPSPSTADVEMTKQIQVAARTVGIVVHDHIIVGRNGHLSLKAARMI